MRQEIRFCSSPDGTRIAYAVSGSGPPLVLTMSWVSHLEYAAQMLTRIGIAVVAATVLAALYGHLREATYYGRRVSLALAAAVTLVIGIAAWIAKIGVDQADINRVALGPDVRLGARRVVPNRDIADYLAEVDALRLAAGRERQKSLLEAPLADADD